MANPFDIQEAALIEMSRLARENEDCTATRRVLMLIDAGKTLEEAQRIEADDKVLDVLLEDEMAVSKDCINSSDILAARLLNAVKIICLQSGESVEDVVQYLEEGGLLKAMSVLTVDVDALADRLWRVHPRDVQDSGLTRAEWYAREIRSAFGLSQLKESSNA